MLLRAEFANGDTKDFLLKTDEGRRIAEEIASGGLDVLFIGDEVLFLRHVRHLSSLDVALFADPVPAFEEGSAT